MTNEQENYLSMAMAARDFLLQNNTITNSLPNYLPFFTGVQNGILEIQRLAEQQELDKTGIAVVKKELKADLIIKAMDIANKITAFAKISNNQILLKEVSYKESELKKCADTLLKEKCQVIYDKGMQYATELQTYNVTPTLLTELQNLINDYNVAIPKPRLGIMEKKQATEQMAQQFDLLNSNFKGIDTLVEMLRYSNKQFYSSYQDARKIVDSGRSSLSLKAKITDKTNGEPVKNAKIVFTLETKKPNEEAVVIEKKTAAKGGFNINNMPEGTWNVDVSKEGYTAQNLKITVVDGETTNLDVNL